MQFGDRVALSNGSNVVCWHELLQNVKRLAGHLEPAGAVALELADPIELATAFLAVVRAGGRALVYDPSWSLYQRAQLGSQLHPTTTLDSAGLQQRLADASGPIDATHRPAATDPFYVGFTSGSTGLPKGYRRHHASWLNSFDVSQQLFDFTQNDVVMAPGSLATSLHLYGVLQALQAGIRVTLVSRFQPRSVLEEMREQNVTVLYSTPTQLQLLLQASQRRSGSALTQVRHLIVSGSKWSQHTRHAIKQLFPNARLTEFYGTSEMSFVSLRNDTQDAPETSVGRPVPGVDIRIGEHPDRPLSTGEVGRIWVRSPLLFDGYECGGGEETRRHGPWLTVGDHGYLDQAGWLYLAGREKRMIVSSGFNFYPEEMELWLAQLPGVQHAAVVGLPDALRGQRIEACISSNRAITDAELLQHCAERFPIHQCPRTWHRLADWPITSSGKTDFNQLKAQLMAVSQ